ncbi:hypothetical protein [Paenibacillus paeoniae]|uniref:hypothetical protein n=1 Tax=Paenibacillus paeoniae TaxID=2292705 RepID=UPI0010586599|nr:hypothetical protein [Paenibacillus paeoniae]
MRRSRTPDLKLAWERSGGRKNSPNRVKGAITSLRLAVVIRLQAGSCPGTRISMHIMHEAFHVDAAK